MEASALQAPAATLAQARAAIGTPLLRFRSDEQLVALFRAGHDEAFRAIHDRYHTRLFAYARQMLPARQDAEDALQDVFVRAYSGLRASDRDLALRAWLFRVAHNRCVDELRRPAPPAPEVLQLVRSPVHDPLAEVDRRESLRRLIADIRRLPDQQRSALLMRELGGMSYADVSASLDVSAGAVKSLLVRARIALAQSAEARDIACSEIREELIGSHDRGVRPNATARRHMRDCTACSSFRRELRGVTRQLAAIAPAAGPLSFVAKVLGISGGAGGGAAGGATAGGGAAVAGGGGAVASAGGIVLGANHVATLLVAAVATAGGAVEIQHTIAPTTHHPAHVRSAARHSKVVIGQADETAPVTTDADAAALPTIASVVQAETAKAPSIPATASATSGADSQKPKHAVAGSSSTTGGSSTGSATPTKGLTSSSKSTATPSPGASITGPAGTVSGTPSSTASGTSGTTASTAPESSAGSSGTGSSGSTMQSTNDTGSSSSGSGTSSPGSGAGTGTSGSGTTSGGTGSGSSSSGSGSSSGTSPSGSGSSVPPV